MKSNFTGAIVFFNIFFFSRYELNSIKYVMRTFIQLWFALHFSTSIRYFCSCLPVIKDHFITKMRLYNIDPFKLHFYIVKVGFTGVDINFLISAQNIDLGTR